MLQFVDVEFGSQLRGGMVFSSAMQVNEGHWIAHSDNYLVDFKYKSGLLSMCMGETYYELDFGERKIIASNKTCFGNMASLIIKKGELEYLITKKFKPSTPTFSDILELLEWKCDDYID